MRSLSVPCQLAIFSQKLATDVYELVFSANVNKTNFKQPNLSPNFRDLQKYNHKKPNIEIPI